jgi:signal transduction histidine kinase
VQDETSGVFLNHKGERFPVTAGDEVEVTGVAKPGRYSSYIDSPSIQPKRTGQAITPEPVSLSRIFHGGLDAQWVEVTGILRSHKFLEDYVGFEISDPPHRIDLWLPSKGDEAALPELGSLIRVRGVVGTLTDSGRLDGFQLFASSRKDVMVLQAATPDPFSQSPTSIGELNSAYIRNNVDPVVRVQGTVALCWPGQTIVVQDGTGAVEVQPRIAVTNLVPGMLVDITGLLGSVLESPILEQAVIHPLETNSAPRPTRVLPRDLISGAFNNRLVEFEADLFGWAYTCSTRLAIAVQAEDYLMTVLGPAPLPRDKRNSLVPGSRVRVFGILRNTKDAQPGSAGTVLVSSWADVTVTHPPDSSVHPAWLVLIAFSCLSTTGLALALLMGYRQRRRMEHVLQLQAGFQAEMRTSQQQLRRAMEERERIGRDLHDDIIQSIYAVGLSLENCRRISRQSPEQIENRLNAAIATLNDTIRSVRGFIAGLEPKILNGRELKTALKSLALTSGEGPTQFHIEVDAAAANVLTSTQATQLLRIAKEAMSNSLRHAQASNVSVSLTPLADGIRLEVCDDGVGFDPAAARPLSQGLNNIAARVQEISAQLQILSAPGKGCRIIVKVPQENLHEPS